MSTTLARQRVADIDEAEVQLGVVPEPEAAGDRVAPAATAARPRRVFGCC